MYEAIISTMATAGVIGTMALWYEEMKRVLPGRRPDNIILTDMYMKCILKRYPHFAMMVSLII